MRTVCCAVPPTPSHASSNTGMPSRQLCGGSCLDHLKADGWARIHCYPPGSEEAAAPWAWAQAETDGMPVSAQGLEVGRHPPWRGSSGQRPTWAPEQRLELGPSFPQRGTNTHPAVLSPVWAQGPNYSPYYLLNVQTAPYTLTAPTPLNTQLTAPPTTHSPDTSTNTVTPHTNTFLTSSCRKYTHSPTCS